MAPDTINAHDVSVKILRRFRSEHICPHHIFFKKGVLCAALNLGSLAHLVFCLNWPTYVHLSIPNWRQRKRGTLLLGLCAGLTLRRRSSDIISRPIDVGNISPRHLCAIMTIVWYHTRIFYILIIIYIPYHIYHCDINTLLALSLESRSTSQHKPL